MRKYALVIGVDTVNHQYYGANKDLCSSKKDTLEIEKQLYSSGFTYDNIFVRNNSRTSWSYILDDLNFLKREVNNNSEDTFIMIYFSGHGASIEMPKSQEYKQFICLYDQIIPEDFIQEKLCEFNSNAKILVVFDSCYAEGLKPKKYELLTRQQKKPVKNLSEEFKSIFKLHYDYYTKCYKNYSNFVFIPKADILFLFACLKTQTTSGGMACDELSVYTTSFLSAWNTLKMSGSDTSFQVLIDLIKQVSGNNPQSHPETISQDSFFHTGLQIIFN